MMSKQTIYFLIPLMVLGGCSVTSFSEPISCPNGEFISGFNSSGNGTYTVYCGAANSTNISSLWSSGSSGLFYNSGTVGIDNEGVSSTKLKIGGGDTSSGELFRLDGRSPSIWMRVTRDTTSGLAFNLFNLEVNSTVDERINTAPLVARVGVRGDMDKQMVNMIGISAKSSSVNDPLWYNKFNFAVGQSGVTVINPLGKDIYNYMRGAALTDGNGLLVYDGNLLVRTGVIRIPEYIQHEGDTNTQLRFLTDEVRIIAGGILMLEAEKIAQNTLKLAHHSSSDIDINMANKLYLDDALNTFATTELSFGIGTLTPNQKIQVVGNANVSGTVYYGALQANSPHAFLNDEIGYTRICKMATDGIVVMETIELVKGRYVKVYTPNSPDCNKEVLSESKTHEQEFDKTRVSLIEERTYKNVWTKQERTETIDKGLITREIVEEELITREIVDEGIEDLIQ